MNAPGMNEDAIRRGIELRLKALLEGIESAFPPGLASVHVRGVDYKPDELTRKALEVLEPWEVARRAHETLRKFAQERPHHDKVALEFLADVKAAFSAHLGRENEALSRFGFTPLRKPSKPSVEELAIRKAKAKLTREKRGTLGKRQREAIKAEGTPSVEIGPDGTLKVIEPENRSNPNERER